MFPLENAAAEATGFITPLKRDKCVWPWELILLNSAKYSDISVNGMVVKDEEIQIWILSDKFRGDLGNIRHLVSCIKPDAPNKKFVLLR